MGSNSEKIILSIIIPVYNRQEQLNQLLDSLSQSLSFLTEKIEIIIIDDYSDEPILINNAFQNLSLKRNENNYGAPISRMIGFQMSSGTYIHFHDSDDSISTNWFSNLVQQLKEKPDLDILITGRIDHKNNTSVIKYQKYSHRNQHNIENIADRLVYRNCLGPMGGVTFSRSVIEHISFKSYASCQDWQMYLDAIEHTKMLVSRPDIHFIFNKTGDDRISHNPRKKILGHLQLAKISSKKSVFERNIRLFYLYTCKQHIFKKGGAILKFYKKNRLSIFVTYLIVSVYWRIT